MELTKEEAIELLNERFMTMSMCLDSEYCAKQNAALDMAISALRVDSADIINRQKAEIEQLKVKNEILIKNADTAFQDGLNEAQGLYALQIRNEVKQEVIKEFVERLKDELRLDDECEYDCYDCCYGCKDYVRVVDSLAKEMKEEQ